ncbi:hypothetical protein FHR70_003214 [Microvirga lupini]|uniref:Uncharacterized protein n=1 Tax=Microvirga lupini TaxID=420324 RepID=A0A7W4VMY0_9HYPH|nr:hypothetical protein [Microvirga lupini]
MPGIHDSCFSALILRRSRSNRLEGASREHWCLLRDGRLGNLLRMRAAGVRLRLVLILFLTLVLSWAISWFILVHRGARSRGVADAGRGAVPPQVSHACDRGWPILAQIQVR